jgi:hypothetical protein
VTNHDRKEPLLVYSLNLSLALDLVLAAPAIGYGAFLLLSGGTPPYPWIVGILFLGDFYFRLWRRPVRRALFFDDHLEISGRKVRLSAGYDQIRGLGRFRQSFGDFASDSRVSFTVVDSPASFVVPNRRDRKLKLDLYSFLKQKAPQAMSATPGA